MCSSTRSTARSTPRPAKSSGSGEHDRRRPTHRRGGARPRLPDHVTAETIAAIERIPHRYLRTSIHPSAALVPDADTFDDVYETRRPVRRRLHRDRRRLSPPPTSTVRSSTPSPARRSCSSAPCDSLLADDRVEVEVLRRCRSSTWPGPGSASTRSKPRRPSRRRPRVRDRRRRRHRVPSSSPTPTPTGCSPTSSWRSTTPTAGSTTRRSSCSGRSAPTTSRSSTTTWAEMDRTIDADHLTSLYIPALASRRRRGYVRFHQLARTLREQCPWDIEQTHQTRSCRTSSRRPTRSSTRSVPRPRRPRHRRRTSSRSSATCSTRSSSTPRSPSRTAGSRSPTSPPASTTSSCAATRTCSVTSTATDGEVADAGEVLDNWDAIKRAEKGRTSVFDGIAGSLPSLAYAHQVQKKAAKVGFDWPDVDGALPKIVEEAAELRAIALRRCRPRRDRRRARRPPVRRRERRPPPARRPRGRPARRHQKFRGRFEHVERLARERGIDLHATDLATLDALWDEVKARSSCAGRSSPARAGRHRSSPGRSSRRASPPRAGTG
jgi:tetrapyrrole methylase family protein / MazG family protein